jgi:hypothetical protein
VVGLLPPLQSARSPPSEEQGDGAAEPAGGELGDRSGGVAAYSCHGSYGVA